MSETISDLSAIPVGRIPKLVALDTALRAGESYEAAAAKLKIALNTAKTWAASAAIRKSDVSGETPEARAARLVGWALQLSALGRFEEAAACETAARRIERLLARLAEREAAAAEEGDDGAVVAGAFLSRVMVAEASEDVWQAWSAVTLYFAGQRALGAELLPDGRVEWPGQAPQEALVPGWLPEAPWAVSDVEAWEREVGAALRVL
ncbi:MAG: hypothetical protein RLN72_11055 [Henriciella sp.]